MLGSVGSVQCGVVLDFSLPFFTCHVDNVLADHTYESHVAHEYVMAHTNE